MQTSYHRKKVDREIYKYTLILDEISIIIAFFSAILIRYDAIMNWADRKSGIYISMLITVLLFEIIVYSLFDRKKMTVVGMDPAQNLVSTCKNRAVLALMTIAYFYITQRSVLTSRIVMGIFLCLSTIYGYFFRMLYCILYRKRLGIPGEIKVYRLVLPSPNIDKKINEILDGEYECALVMPDRQNLEYTKEILRRLEKKGIRSYVALENEGGWLGAGVAMDLDNYTVIPAYIRTERVSIFGVKYCIGKTEEAVRHVLDHIDRLRGEYICFSNVHTSVMARESGDYAAILNGAAMVFPDGEPIAANERKRGFKEAERIAGPDFMSNMFRNTADGRFSHYFYGSTEETLKSLRDTIEKEYPGIVIRGMYSPPFRETTREEDKEDIDRINSSGADLVWIGLGAPKQEKWMNAHRGRVNAVMLGVGAGFDFHAGTIDRAPLWMQRIGLEWFYRLISDPKRLFRRYIVTNVKYVIYMLGQLIK